MIKTIDSLHGADRGFGQEMVRGSDPPTESCKLQLLQAPTRRAFVKRESTAQLFGSERFPAAHNVEFVSGM